MVIAVLNRNPGFALKFRTPRILPIDDYRDVKSRKSQVWYARTVINHRARPVNRVDYAEQWRKSVLVLLVLKVSNFEQPHK